jgi:hypothetical protein
MRKEYDLVPLVTNSSTLAPSEMNANTELYMRIWSQNLTALLSLLVKITSSSCGVARRLDNKTLPFSQHIENCGLLLLDFANHFSHHIFVLQNPQIVSIFPQSHRAKANASSSPNNCNASLSRKGYARDVACCIVCCSQCRRLLRSCGVSDGPANSIHYLACRSFYKRVRCSHADFDMSWLNFAGILICGTWFSKVQEISAHPHHLNNTEQMIMFHHPNTTFPHSNTTM